MAKRKTNGQFLKDLCEQDPFFGAIFMDAAAKYTKSVLADPDSAAKISAATSGFVDGESWVAACKVVNEKIESHLKP